MRVALAVVASVALFSLGACGSSAPAVDQFVGTWQPVNPNHSGQQLVITQAQSAYQAFFVGGPVTVGPLSLQRDGDVLVFPAQNGVERQTFTFHSDTGRLTDKDGSAAGVDFELVSRSTSHPPATSQQSAPDQESW